MQARFVAALSLTLTITVAALAADGGKKPVAQNTTVQDELKQFQGGWAVIVMEEGGKKAPDDVVKDMSVTVKEDKLTVKDADKVILEFKVTVDPSKTPKQIDFTYLSGSEK